MLATMGYICEGVGSHTPMCVAACDSDFMVLVSTGCY
eukprot:CAMPEP_0170611602 /NCGR_PEP_ID=MMETSP0224-20130122/23273_1 /TAXON_ID=285029 /ORGANISM="Togula jolla, Strain CCCM 725" /LENGTH=36 /DNA_ID= /DNA_START= /DNA_END= /DNA_ORIENTATION=